MKLVKTTKRYGMPKRKREERGIRNAKRIERLGHAKLQMLFQLHLLCFMDRRRKIVAIERPFHLVKNGIEGALVLLTVQLYETL